MRDEATSPVWKAAADAAMDRYARGEERAFAELYDALAPRLYSFFFRRTNNPDGAADLVQQTFLQMHDARGRFLPGAAVVPWAFAIGRRLLIDGARRKGATLHRDFDEDEFEGPALGGPCADSALDARRALRLVNERLALLPEGQRMAFELVREQGLSVAEAAATLGITATAVKVRVHRATEVLRNLVR